MPKSLKNIDWQVLAYVGAAALSYGVLMETVSVLKSDMSDMKPQVLSILAHESSTDSKMDLLAAKLDSMASRKETISSAQK